MVFIFTLMMWLLIRLVLLFRSVALKGTLIANRDGSHKAVTEKKLSVRFISWCKLHFFVLIFGAHAVFSLECLSVWRERKCSFQLRNNISEAPSPHSALQSAPSFSRDVTQKLRYLKSCESALQHEPNFPHSRSPSSEFLLDKHNKDLSHLYVDSLSRL